MMKTKACLGFFMSEKADLCRHDYVRFAIYDQSVFDEFM